MNTKSKIPCIIIAFVALTIGMSISSGVIAAPQKNVTLRMVGAWAPEVSPDAEVGIHFMKTVNKLSDGSITIIYIGAEEVMSISDQPQALINGIFDVWYGAPNYWAGTVKGGYVTYLSTAPVSDGGPGSAPYNYLVDMYAKHGVRYLGTAAPDAGVAGMYVLTQKKVTSLDDLSGLSLRVPPLTRYFVQAAGADSVTLPPSDIYLAMDRGTVDGFTWPVADGFTNYGWQDVTKYMVDKSLYRNSINIDMDLERWNSLDDKQKNIMLKAVAKTQKWARGWLVKQYKKQVEKMQQAGMKVLKLSDDESKRWTNLSRQALWAHFKKDMNKKEYARARELFATDDEIK